MNGEVLVFGISKDDNDNIRPGRITMKPTTEQNALIAAAKVGIDLLLEDGIMKVNVVEKLSDTELKVKVIRGGKLKARKGVNVPDVEIDCAALTTKDVEDAEFLLQLDPPIEYICVSFVQKGQDLQELIDIMDRLNIPQAPLRSPLRLPVLPSCSQTQGEATQDLPEDREAPGYHVIFGVL